MVNIKTISDIIHPEDAAAPPKLSIGGHETILLVEDEPTLLKITAKMLQHLGYSVVAAGTPDEAIELVENYSGKIDLLITDLIMPGMNCKDLSVKIFGKCPDLKVLYVSGYTAHVITHHKELDDVQLSSETIFQAGSCR